MYSCDLSPDNTALSFSSLIGLGSTIDIGDPFTKIPLGIGRIVDVFKGKE
jgi:hypothetical protein